MPSVAMKSRFALSTLIGITVALAVAGAVFYRYETKPESSPVSRGAKLAHAAGCIACHGNSIDDPRANFRLRDEAWTDESIAPIWEEEHSAKSLITWITHGVPERKRESHQEFLLQMPAYGDDGHMTAAEIEDVAAWALAVGMKGFQGYDTIEEDMPDLEVADIAELEEAELITLGDRLSRQSGCYQCHGELGQGGAENFASFRGYIPGFQGGDFRKLTDDANPAEIRHWIEHGRGVAIESGILGGMAKKYFEEQAIPMPAYEGVLSDGEIELLVAYLKWINKKGPLDMAAIETIGETIYDNL
jgi:mono/diheme cytochrome c family protein